MLGIFRKLRPNPRNVVKKMGGAVKSALLKHSNLFEALQFRYFGPVDGHDVIHLSKVLADLKDIPGPKLLHVVTTKGKGYKFSEEGDQTTWHSPGLFDKHTGKIFKVETLEIIREINIFVAFSFSCNKLVSVKIKYFSFRIRTNCVTVTTSFCS